MKRFARSAVTRCLMCLGCLAALSLAPVASSPANTDAGTSGSAGQRIHIGENFLISGAHSDCSVYGKPAIAFDGQNFLVAWHDAAASSTSTVYASRVTPDGALLDSGGIPLPATPWDSGPAAVAFDGENYMVVWDGTMDDVSWELFCARVTPSGEVLAPGVQQLTNGSGCWGGRPVGISFDGSEFMVVFRTTDTQIRGLRLSRSGTSLDGPAGFPITLDGKYPSVAFDGTNFFVVWHTATLDYRGARVTTGGVVLDPDGITICSGPDFEEHGSVAFAGGCYLVVWEEWSADRLRGSTRGARVSVAGEVLDTTPLNIGERCRGENAVMVNSDGNDFLVTWAAETEREDGGANPDFRLIDSWGRRVSPDGSFVDEAPFPIATARWHATSPLAGYGAGRYLVAWRDNRLDSPTVWGQILDAGATGAPAPNAPGPPAGSPTVWTPESSSTADAIYAIVAFDGEHAMAFGAADDLVRDPSGWAPGSCEPWTVYDAFALSGDDVWTSGWAQGVHHLNGSIWSGVGGGSSDPSLIDTGIWGTDDEHLWFSGAGGTVRVGPGMDGLPGEFQNVGTTADLHDVWGFTWDDIYTVGEFGLVFHFDGQTWSRVPGIPTWQTLNAVWGSGPNDIFAIGDFGTILHYDGAQWVMQYSGTAEDLQGLWGRNDSDVYAVGFGSTILHYDGVGWTSESSGVAEDLLSVAGAPDQDGTMSVWIGGSAGRILHARYPVANQAPAGVPDAYSTAHDQALVVPPLGVLANDVDTDGDPLRVELVSGVAHGQLDLAPTGWFTYSPAPGWDGSDGFTYRVTDGFSSSAVTAVSILVASAPDSTPPTTTAGGADDAWHNAPVTVTFSAVDNAGGSGMVGGLAKTEYKVDGAAAWTTGTSVLIDAPAGHANDGAHSISYRSIDAAGNIEAAKSCTVKIDTTGSVVTATGITASAWYRADKLVTLTATDEAGGSGVASITYTLDGVETTVPGANATVSVPVLPNAAHTLVFHASDQATNASAAQTLAFTSDNTGPVTAARATSGRVNRLIALRYKIADNLSPGAKAIRIVVKNRRGRIVKTLRPTAKDTATWYGVKWRARAKGTYRYSVYAKDLAGNAQRIRGSARVVVR